VRDSHRHVTRKRWLRSVAAGTVVALTVAWGGLVTSSGASAPTQGKQKTGGSITYGLEAPTTNFCLPNAQLAISGIVVTTAVYDTLTVPDKDGKYVPYLAQSVEHDPGYMSWTIKVRPNVTFHDGEPLNADAVKLNLDAYAGKSSAVSAPLFGFVLSNIDSVNVVDPMTVQVNMKTPWVEFDQYLWSTGRLGMAAPAQLNSPNCQTNMIGTGPFKLQNFDPVTGNVDVTKNTSYWRQGYPKLDAIKFVPVPDGSQRLTQFQGGALDIVHDSVGRDLTQYEKLGGEAKITKQTNGRMEITHTLPNVTRPPFDDPNARKAVAEGLDRNKLNELVNDGKARLANGVFDSKVEGYMSNAGYPKYNPKDAKKLVQQYKDAHGGRFEFSYQSGTDQLGIDTARLIKSELGKIGVTVNLPQPVDQPTIINQAIGGAVDTFGWRNYPGLVGDTMYVWFYGTTMPGGSARNPVNFNHIDDPQMNQALDQARAEPDQAKRTQLYEQFNKAITSPVYSFWGWYTPWFIVTKPGVKGVVGPNLPDANGSPGSDKPSGVLAGYHQLLGLSKG
jgi:peptide/nickel transport system substrate-binding protein